MDLKRKKKPEREMSYVETPVLTGQYPAFGIENPGKLPAPERQPERKPGKRT